MKEPNTIDNIRQWKIRILPNNKIEFRNEKKWITEYCSYDIIPAEVLIGWYEAHYKIPDYVLNKAKKMIKEYYKFIRE